MATRKYLEIDSDSQETIQELFMAICNDVLKIDPRIVKKRAMGFLGKDSTIDRRQPTLLEVLELCSVMDIPYKFHLRLEYDDTELTMEQRRDAKRFRAPDLREGYRESDLTKKLEEQAQRLTNPELKAIEIKEEKAFEKKSVEASKDLGFKPGDVPDFPGAQ